jgi:dTMP kinase
MQRGKLITFEGGEGSGKSTQCQLLNEALKKEGLQTLVTREPGGTEQAEIIRELLVKGDINKWSSKTELLLHFAARIEHMQHKILPALEQNQWVICDRFIDSTIAYQAHGHQLGNEYVEQLQKLLIGNFQPDITFVLHIDFEKGIERSLARHNAETRYEKMDKTFHQRVHQGYLETAKRHPKRCVLIDASSSIEEIHQQIFSHIQKRFDTKY